MKTKTKKTTQKVTKEVTVAKKSPVKKEVVKKEITIKKLSKKAKIYLLALLVLLVLIGGCFYKFGIVATVNGKPIYRLAYLQKLQKSDTTVLNSMVQDALINSEAKNKGIVIDQKEIDDSLATIETQIKAQGMTFEEALKSENLTKEELESQIRTQKIAEKLVSPSADPTQAEIDAYLKENKDYLPTGKTADELQTLAKQQIKSQAENTAINTWFNNLKAAAKIIYR